MHWMNVGVQEDVSVCVDGWMQFGRLPIVHAAKVMGMGTMAIMCPLVEV